MNTGAHEHIRTRRESTGKFNFLFRSSKVYNFAHLKSISSSPASGQKWLQFPATSSSPEPCFYSFSSLYSLKIKSSLAKLIFDYSLQFEDKRMYKNQLQELAQRSCFNLPSYSCIREGPDHAPRFKAKVSFNGETFESPNFFSTLRQAEHASAEVALKTLSQRGPSRALAARVLDETGVYKNLLQETAHRAGLNLPVYTTVRSGVGGVPLFACTVELAGMSFKGEPAKTKKQAQKSAAMSAWFSLKNLSMQDSSTSTSSESGGKEEQEQMSVARYLSKFQLPERRKPPSKPPSVKNDVIPYHVNRRSGHQNYAYFPLSPEMAYQNWHHGVTLPRSYLLTSPPPPLSISGPQFFPFVQSIFGPYTFPSDPLVQSAPFLYMAGGDVAPTGTSRVRIEEIEEHNNQPEDEWLNKNLNSHGKTCNREDLVSWVTPGFLRNDTGPVTVGQPTISRRNPDYSRFLPPPCSTRRPPLFPPLETSHININAATPRVPRPWLERSRVPCARTMAPAVQIRSVVPVCSAPGQRVPSHSQVASSSSSKSGEMRRIEGTFDRVSTASSEFSRLQL